LTKRTSLPSMVRAGVWRRTATKTDIDFCVVKP
jgi:hypothetical protein